MSFDKVELDVLGSARRVVATRDNTIIAGGGGSKEKVDERIKQILTQAKETKSGFEKTKLEERASKLSGGVAVLKVGAPTESEIKEIKYKVEDALNATKAAVEEGIVVGGGVALIRAMQNAELPKLSPEEMVGVNILWKAVESPLYQIAQNAGVSGDVVVNTVKEGKLNFGYNGLTRLYDGDLMKSGIIDPVKVTRSALQNAVSIATMFLTSDAIITEIPPKEKKEELD
jgi:chaperonin GroEL